MVDRDEEPFRSDLDKMGTLRPAFDREGTVTAANASKINDGAAALVLASASRAAALGAKPLARIVAHSTHCAGAGVVHHGAGQGGRQRARARRPRPPATSTCGRSTRPSRSSPWPSSQELGLPHDEVNVRGGAVALGHPIGASGARILVTLLHAMAERGARRGCAAICIGGGEATAIVVEREV